MEVHQLISLAKEGDKPAGDRVFQYLYARFKLIAGRRVGREFAEDLAQDACITVFEKFDTDVPPERFEAWAYSILRNKIGNFLQGRDIRRKAESSLELNQNSAGRDTKVADPALRLSLLDCLRSIIKTYPRYARVLNLVHQGYTTGEISKRLSITANHLYVLLNRSRRMLNDCLEHGPTKAK